MTDPEPTGISTFGRNSALNLGSETWYEDGLIRDIEDVSAQEGFHELETAKHNEAMCFGGINCEVGIDTTFWVDKIVGERWMVYPWQEV